MSGHSPRTSERRIEEKLHADGIDSGDAERVADRGVGDGAASLYQDAVIGAPSGRQAISVTVALSVLVSQPKYEDQVHRPRPSRKSARRVSKLRRSRSVESDL